MPDPQFHRNIELDDAAQSQLLEPKKRLSKAALAIVFGLVALPILAAPFLFQKATAPERSENNSDDDLLPPTRVQLTLPPPAPLVEEQSSSRIAEPVIDTAAAEQLARERAEFEEQKRIAAAEQAARDAENDQKKWERYRSPMVVSEAGQAESNLGDPAKTPEEAAKSAATFQDTNPNSQLLGALSAKPVEVSKAERTKRIDALVPQGTMIRGVLETAVQTDLPGMVRAVTTEDVWSFDGRRVLVPSGTRLIGEYNAGLAQGQTRAFIVWTRLLREDGVSLSLGSPGTDELGVTGSGGDVNNHYFKRFGSAILLTALSAAPQLLAEPSVSVRRRRNSGPVTTVITDPITGKVTQTTTYPEDDEDGIGANLGQKGAQVLAEGFAQVAQEALKGTVNIQPTISINQGTPVAIFVKRDLDFSDLYPDPVLEKFKELKRGRYGIRDSAWHNPVHKGGLQ
ncbi:type IV secretion system protein VirB10 [Phyllobacterium sp. YR531]|uniref:type IV secretion system protein VirB10 n=1 Tax=Phyllobacterium sp. YR531 TaxID=1144343 RepID=UPI00026F642D|nr:type IV secretion system protein VirB10 [Phyllobacterium sp. YR531]EJN02770.1 type IV secretory pathway, VirB10 component [Phyllobacterium sp. YR531]